MAGKPFNPFEDDDNMEFVPEGGTDEGEVPGNVASQTTHIKQIPLERPKRKSNLKIDFSEINDLGTDTRGAEKIGAEKLPADDFLTGIKRKDYEVALQKAKASQNAAALAPVQREGTVRKVRAPLYLFVLATILFFGTLYGGYQGYKRYLEVQEAARIKALQEMNEHNR
jgi:hypothetical protein